MTKNKFATGAFVFSRARGLQPRDPAELKPLALKHGLETTIIPDYAGDRATIGRAVQQTSAGLFREGFLLRPIKRTGSEVLYAIVRETKNQVTERVDHEQRAVLRWCAETDPARVEGDHPIAQRVAESYAAMRAKVCTEDWSASITSFLETHDAVALRRDGRIYWVPPQRLKEIRRFQEFLKEVGIDLFVAELEPGAKDVITEVVRENMADQLDTLEAEVQAFDGTQKPSTYTRRLEEYQRLRERAILYRDALGVGVEKTHAVLANLERSVTSMLELRKTTVVHRDGSVNASDAGGDGDAGDASDADSTTDSTPATVRFAGAVFDAAQSDDASVLRFVSDDDFAKSSAQALAAMGVAGKWQQAGPVEVSIENNGPPGEAVHLCIRVPDGQSLFQASKALAGIGIELGLA